MRRLVVLAAVALLAVGCSDDDGDEVDASAAGGSATTEAPADGASDDADDASGDAAPASGDGTMADATVALADTSLGEVLAGPDGFTLYLFTNDAEGASNCTDGCAEVWPPLTVEGDPTAGDGLDPDLLGTIERPDGGTQVTYGGHPLYTYAPDAAPGDVTGHGVGDVWFAVDASGEAVQSS